MPIGIEVGPVHLDHKRLTRPHHVEHPVSEERPYVHSHIPKQSVDLLHSMLGQLAELQNASGTDRNSVTISYDEKPGIQALQAIAADLLPVPHRYPSLARDYEYKRLGTVSLLASIDLHTGHVIPLVRDRHRSREFIEFLQKLDSSYPERWTIRVVLDNHSSHISKETQTYLRTKPGRFQFVFTPTHGSWLNLIEAFFSKIARSLLRHIRVDSKEELVHRIYAGIEEINQEPVIFRWRYKMAETTLS